MRAKPKKRLGQNFLIDKNIQQKIISSCHINASDIILEIGSGKGEITRLIADQAQKVYALEIDKELCAILNNSFLEARNIEIINQDFLKFDLPKFTQRAKINKLKVIGNIPYYITTPIIERLIKFKDSVSQAFLTVQKEFAQRITAKDNTREYGAFSCYAQFHSDARILFAIKNNSFFPAPKVSSCFIELAFRQKPPVVAINEDRLFKIIRSAFNQRRKTLRNSLKEVVSKEKLNIFFKENNISLNARPENLSLKDFSALANI